jgi:hypothetical protein
MAQEAKTPGGAIPELDSHSSSSQSSQSGSIPIGGRKVKEVRILLDGKSYPALGYSVQIGWRAFDWLYIVGSEPYQVLKLHGLDQQSNQFIWRLYAPKSTLLLAPDLRRLSPFPDTSSKSQTKVDSPSSSSKALSQSSSSSQCLGGTWVDGVCVSSSSSTPSQSNAKGEEPIQLRAIIKGKSYPISGYWAKVGDTIFDWVYIGFSSRTKRPQAYKLEGLDPDRGEFIWSLYPATQIQIEVEGE